MSNKKTSDGVDAIPFLASDSVASSYAATPVYASSLAASNSYRSSQWYLDGTLTVGGNEYGANVDKISTEYTGAGVKVGIIDQGFDTTNIDLIGRFDLAQSVDPRDTGVTSIMPDSSGDAHGTWVSGVIGASAINQTGAVGVAPDSTLVGYYARFGLGGSSAAELGNLLGLQVNVDVSNSSWGFSTPFSDNFIKPSWSPVKDSLINAVEHGRDSLGTVYVFAAGNDRQYVPNTPSDGDNTNYHSLTNSRFIITAAASDSYGHIAPFSTPGDSIMVTAPGVAIVTTAMDDGDGDPTNNFAAVSGTSFSAPIVSGIVAIMLEANPDLGYRDVQEILALSSRKIDPTSASWSTNGASNWNGGGNLVSHDYGFGLIDAHAAARLAETWTTQHTAANEQVIDVAGDIGSNGLLSQSIANSYSVAVTGNHQQFSVEWVELDIKLKNAHNGDLKIELISPDGTDSVLLDHPGAGTNMSGNLNFTFTTNHNWGETPNGNWTVVIQDSGTSGTDAIVSYSLRIYGDDHGTDNSYFYTDDFATLSGDRGSLADASGIDTLNAAAVTTDLALDLRPGHTSIIAGRSVDISADTIIEKAYGGDGDDLIIGNGADNTLYGGHGHNILQGEGGNDVLDGGPDGSILIGGVGNDIYDVRSSADATVENPNEGTDGARVYIDHYTLSANIENGLAELTSGQTLSGNDLNNWLLGNTGNDTLIGGAGNDSLDGGAGNDTLIGGIGDDVYVVDSPGDTVVEHPGEGTDVVFVQISGYTLADNVEVGAVAVTTGLTLVGNDADNILWGNVGDDTLVGGGGNDLLLGGLGADTMVGGSGDDVYAVDSLGDVIVEHPGEGMDIAIVTASGYTLSDDVEVGAIAVSTGAALTGGHGNTVLWGNSGDDALIGQGGDDVLIGGAGADTMMGGAGNDIYVVDNPADVVIEHAGEGADTVYVWTSGYTLNDNVEIGAVAVADGLILTGNAGDNFLWGNAGNDTLIGGDGNDFISGGAGADTLIGGTGDDTFVVDHIGDSVIENPGEGTDTVLTLVKDYTLGDNVEVGGILSTDGATLRANDQGNSLWGGQGNDLLIGGAGNDTLSGGGGHDILTGGAGNDTFVFQRGASDGNSVTDFAGDGDGHGDILVFSGYGSAEDGARFTQIDDSHWEISSADGSIHEQVLFENHAAISSNDWHFV